MEEMSLGKINIEGNGNAADALDENGEIKLPPIPEGAIEYDQLNSVKEGSDAELTIPSESMFKVSNTGIDTDLENLMSPLSILNNLVDDPMPTPAKPGKEFNPLIQKALDDLDNEGGVSKAASTEAIPMIAPIPIDMAAKTETIRSMGDLFASKAPTNGTYNAPIQNALSDDETEGGIVPPKSTGFAPSDGDHSKEGYQNKSVVENDIKDKFRIYGFIVQYNENGKTITREVSDFFDDRDVALYSLNGGHYLMPGKDKIRFTNIVSGSPLISFNEQSIAKYHNSQWKRL